MIPFWTYLEGREVSNDDVFTKKIARKSKLYVLVDGKLYRKGSNEIFMKCITQEEGNKLLLDIHWGMCGNHAFYRTLVKKAFP